jgi:hypothetical protein
MLKKMLLPLAAVFVTLGVLGACATMESSYQLPVSHPSAADLGEQPRTCTNCHDPQENGNVPYERFVHGSFWVDNHRQASYQGEQVCALCHQTSFCNDCHATNVELKPSLKNQTDTTRRMPHRGDYLSRHRIDGRIDPTSCFRCHGNPKSAKACASCHG